MARGTSMRQCRATRSVRPDLMKKEHDVSRAASECGVQYPKISSKICAEPETQSERDQVGLGGVGENRAKQTRLARQRFEQRQPHSSPLERLISKRCRVQQRRAALVPPTRGAPPTLSAPSDDHRPTPPQPTWAPSQPPTAASCPLPSPPFPSPRAPQQRDARPSPTGKGGAPEATQSSSRRSRILRRSQVSSRLRRVERRRPCGSSSGSAGDARAGASQGRLLRRGCAGGDRGAGGTAPRTQRPPDAVPCRRARDRAGTSRRTQATSGEKKSEPMVVERFGHAGRAQSRRASNRGAATTKALQRARLVNGTAADRPFRSLTRDGAAHPSSALSLSHSPLPPTSSPHLRRPHGARRTSDGSVARWPVNLGVGRFQPFCRICRSDSTAVADAAAPVVRAALRGAKKASMVVACPGEASAEASPAAIGAQ